MDDRSRLELDPETMRMLGYAAIDRLVERWEGLRDDRPHEVASRAELEARFGERAPEEGTDPLGLIREAVEEILPLAGRIDHPRFMGFVPSSPTWPALIGDLLATGFNTFQGTWLESAGPSQIELTVLEWFREWIGMPEGAGGLLTSGGSAANLLAVALARDLAGSPERPVVYLSDQGHGSLSRACRIVGIPAEGIRVVRTDSDLRMSTEHVREAIAADVAAGRTPLLVCASGGTTNTGVVDPLVELRELTREHSMRLHVDAAYGGFAALDPEGARALEGLGAADSVTLDPHKWFYQPYECGCLLVSDPIELHRVFRSSADYLQDTELGEAQINFSDRGLQLTRKFRALKVWMSVKCFGMAAFREEVGRGMELARRAGPRIEESPWLELLAPPSLGVVCYRFNPVDAGMSEEELDAMNRRLQEEIVADGVAMVSSTRLRNRFALRLCILNYRTRWDDVEAILSWVEARGREATA